MKVPLGNLAGIAPPRPLDSVTEKLLYFCCNFTDNLRHTQHGHASAVPPLSSYILSSSYTRLFCLYIFLLEKYKFKENEAC